MINFNFKLEKVLNYKRTMENYKKSQYGTVQQRLNDEEIKLESFNQHKNNLENEKNLSVIKTKAGNLMMYNNYINNIAAKIKAQEDVITETKEELEEAKEELVIALKEKKIFEKLKENEYKEYLYQLKKQEEKQIDTLISYKSSTQ